MTDDITTHPIHVKGAKRGRVTTLLLLLNKLAMFWMTIQLFQLQTPLVHLIAIKNVWEVQHFENWISLLSHEFPLALAAAETVGSGARHLGLWDEDVVITQRASLELAAAEARDELRFGLF